MSLAEGMTPADIGAVCGRNDDFGNGAWWIIILFLFVFMGGGFWGNRGTQEQPVSEAGLCNAMNFNNLENAVGRLSDQNTNQTMALGNGMANLGYENLRNFASMQSAVKDGDYALSSQLANCCCQNRYDALQNANATQRMIDKVNYNLATDTCSINSTSVNNARDVIDNQNANTRAILDSLNAQRLEAKQERINSLERQVSALSLAQSQTLQNQYLVGQIRPVPIPAYTVANPFGGGTTTTA